MAIKYEPLELYVNYKVNTLKNIVIILKFFLDNI